jgi:hypothetical protein
MAQDERREAVFELPGRVAVFRKADQVYVLGRLEADEIMPPNVLRSLCRFMGVPPRDFGLDPKSGLPLARSEGATPV